MDPFKKVFQQHKRMMIVMSSIGLVLFLVLSIHIFTSAAEEQEEIKTKI